MKKHRETLKQRWYKIHQRCYNPEPHQVNTYKTIKVCSEWHAFPPFYTWAVDNGFSPELTLDRIESADDYRPDNCRWITIQEQQRNRSNNIVCTIYGETKRLIDWGQDPRCKVSYKLLSSRYQDGWDMEKAMTTSADWQALTFTIFGECKTLTEWVTDPRCVVPRATLYARLVQFSWDPVKALTQPSRGDCVLAFGEYKSYGAWAKDLRCLITRKGLQKRIETGWDLEEAITTPGRSGASNKQTKPNIFLEPLGLIKNE